MYNDIVVPGAVGPVEGGFRTRLQMVLAGRVGWKWGI